VSVQDRYELSRMTIDMLRAHAADLMIEGYDEMSREVLVEAIVARVTQMSPAPGSISWIDRRLLRRVEQAEEGKEPTEVYIDRGLPLPESYPGTRLRVLVRDPGTIFVYWEAEEITGEGWELAAWSTEGELLASFRSLVGRSGSGYLLCESSRVVRVTLSPVAGGEVREVRLGAAVALGAAQEPAVLEERWVDFRDMSSVAEAPAPGRAPMPGDAVLYPEGHHGPGGGPSSWSRPGQPSSWSAGLPSSDLPYRRR